MCSNRAHSFARAVPKWFAGLREVDYNNTKRVTGKEFKELFPSESQGFSYDFNKMIPINDDRLYYIAKVDGAMRPINRRVLFTETATPTKCGGLCRNAKGPSCDCSCKGVNHGSGSVFARSPDAPMIPQKPNIDDINQVARDYGKRAHRAGVQKYRDDAQMMGFKKNYTARLKKEWEDYGKPLPDSFLMKLDKAFFDGWNSGWVLYSIDRSDHPPKYEVGQSVYWDVKSHTQPAVVIRVNRFTDPIEYLIDVAGRGRVNVSEDSITMTPKKSPYSRSRFASNSTMTIKGVQYEVIRKMKLSEGQQVWRMTSLQTPEDKIQYDLVKYKSGEWILWGESGRIVAQGKGNFSRSGSRSRMGSGDPYMENKDVKVRKGERSDTVAFVGQNGGGGDFYAGLENRPHSGNRFDNQLLWMKHGYATAAAAERSAIKKFDDHVARGGYSRSGVKASFNLSSNTPTDGMFNIEIVGGNGVISAHISSKRFMDYAKSNVSGVSRNDSLWEIVRKVNQAYEENGDPTTVRIGKSKNFRSGSKAAFARSLVASQGNKRIYLDGPDGNDNFNIYLVQLVNTGIPNESPHEDLLRMKSYSTEARARVAAKKMLSSRNGVKSLMQKEYVLWGVPEGETDQLHAKVLSTQAKTPSEMDDIKRRASAAGWHSFRVQILDPDKPTRMFSRTRPGNTSMSHFARGQITMSDIFSGYMGNGLSISNRAHEVNGDYEPVAHIQYGGAITWRIKDKSRLDPSVIAYIEKASRESAAKKSQGEPLAHTGSGQGIYSRSRFGIAERVLNDGSVHLDFKVFRESLSGKSDSSLNFIMRDAADARDAMGPDGKKFNYYADIVNEVGDEIARRKNGKSRSNRSGDRKQSFEAGDSFMVEGYVGNAITGGRSARTMEEAEHYANAMLANIKRSAGGKPVKVEIQEIKAYSPQGVIKTMHSRSDDPVANMVMKLKSKIARETPREGTENFHKQVLRELDSILSDIKDNSRDPEVQQLDMTDVKSRLQAMAPRGSAVMRELDSWAGFARGESEISTRFGSIASKLGVMPDSITDSNGVATLKFAQADGSAGRCAFAMISPLTGIVGSDRVTATDTEVRVQFARRDPTKSGVSLDPYTTEQGIELRDGTMVDAKRVNGRWSIPSLPEVGGSRTFQSLVDMVTAWEGKSKSSRSGGKAEFSVEQEISNAEDKMYDGNDEAPSMIADLVRRVNRREITGEQANRVRKLVKEARAYDMYSRSGGKAEFGSDVILEDIGDDQVRATARVEGRSAGSFDGPRSQSAQLLLKALKIAGQGHEVSSGVYDMTHITLNDAAKRAMPKSAMMSRNKAKFGLEREINIVLKKGGIPALAYDWENSVLMVDPHWIHKVREVVSNSGVITPARLETFLSKDIKATSGNMWMSRGGKAEFAMEVGDTVKVKQGGKTVSGKIIKLPNATDLENGQYLIELPNQLYNDGRVTRELVPANRILMSRARFGHANQQIADGVAQLLSVLGFAEMAAEAKTTTDAETLKRYINVARSRFKGTDQADRVKVLTDKLERMLMSREKGWD